MCALEERFARHLAPGRAAIARDSKLEFDEEKQAVSGRLIASITRGD
jgi:hypothetical protein